MAAIEPPRTMITAARDRDSRTHRKAETVGRLRRSAEASPWRRVPGLSETVATTHTAALSMMVPAIVGEIGFTRASVYAEMWSRPSTTFDDLASFVAFSVLARAFPASRIGLPSALALRELAGVLFPVSGRARRLINYYQDLVLDPDELMARGVLSLHAGSPLDETHRTAWAYIVNEILEGPAFDRPGADGAAATGSAMRRIAPKDVGSLKLWLGGLCVEAGSYRASIGAVRRGGEPA